MANKKNSFARYFSKYSWKMFLLIVLYGILINIFGEHFCKYELQQIDVMNISKNSFG